jgi:Skp family chaperone for outer membrane proteins
MFVAAIVFSVSTAAVTAQTSNDKPFQPGAVRVAVVNIGHVFNNYESAKASKKELTDSLEPVKTKAKRLTDELKQWSRMIEDGDYSAFTRNELQTMIQKNRLELGQIENKVRSQMGKKQEDNLVQLWKEVQAGIKTYATQHNIDLVIGYGEPLEKELLDVFPNVNRKMQAMDVGGLTPLFMMPGVDISEGVTALLNKQYRARNQAKAK